MTTYSKMPEQTQPDFSGLKTNVVDYYDDKLEQFGPKPEGVDWDSRESQQLRFKQLARLLPEPTKKFSLLDYGCGYGALFDYLKDDFPGCHYTGFDISERMIGAASRSHPDPRTSWTTTLDQNGRFDFVVASGIFNVRLGCSEDEWERYIFATLAEFNQLGSQGFAFNILTTYSDPEYQKGYLHYADPQLMFEHCKRTFSPQVALLHDYKLYEFTVIVRR